MEANSSTGIPGDMEFVDSCHPTPNGHRILAKGATLCLADHGLIPGLTPKLADAIIQEETLLAAHPLRVDRLPGLGHLANQTCAIEQPGGRETCQGHQALSTQDPHGALQAYLQALNAGGDPGPTHANIGVAAVLAGENEQARTHLAQAIDQLPPDAVADLKNLSETLGPSRPQMR